MIIPNGGETELYVNEKVAELGVGLAAQFKQLILDARQSVTDQEVRMQCVSLIIGRATGDMTDGAIVAAADTLTQYVLTGKKPGEA